jgi:DNA (cytosine-5-)-methyltransferase
MIFSPILEIVRKDELLEKIAIYTRLVHIVAESNNVSISVCPKVIPQELINELVDIGIITDKIELSALSNLLKSSYIDFLNCVSFVLRNKLLFGSVLDKLSNKKRRELQTLEQKSGKPTVVDFFSGAGGLSYGFVQAGFRISLANDFEEVCVRTYRFNHPEIASNKVIHGDIKELVENLPDYHLGNVDVVIGGPPCQGFSSANQQRIIDDSRNELYKYFVRAVELLSPKFVVMENVKGMLKVADQVVQDYSEIRAIVDGNEQSYIVSYQVLNSVDFSVAQNRERLIYIAIREDIATEKGITPSDIFAQIKKRNQGKPRYLLSDALEAIRPLEAPRIKNQNEVDNDIFGKKIDVNSFIGQENAYLETINQGRKIPFVFNHKARFVNSVNYDIYRLLEQGNDASDPKIADIMPYKNRLHCFKDKYYKLIANRPSRTITAHLRMDCHSHIHPFQVRAITPREAARIQSFPDDYLFLGPYLKTYMQIGNAVPCLMGKGIAETIKEYI